MKPNRARSRALRAFRAFFLRFQGNLGILLNQQPESIGGQAVVEGVLMRSATRLAVAVRAPDGSIALQSKPFMPFSRRNPFFGLPIIRGAVSLIESLYIGTQALNWSISVQQPIPDEKEKVEFDKASSSGQKVATAITLVASFGLALVVFQLLPYGSAAFLVGSIKDVSSHPTNPLLFNGVAGTIRISLLLFYMWGLSFFPDVARLFQYHGAEHKSIFTFENKAPLEVSEVVKQSRFHPRCGTSFILIVALVCVLFFSLVDAALLHFFGYTYPNFLYRFAMHLPFVPFVAGISFEFLKLSSKYQDSTWVQILISPGLWLQKITTREPDEKQIEVAIASVKASLAPV